MCEHKWRSWWGSVAVVAVLISAVPLVAACGGPKAPGAENVACFRANDCQQGLVCVEGRCTRNIEPIVPEGAGSGAPGGAAPPQDAPDAGGG